LDRQALEGELQVTNLDFYRKLFGGKRLEEKKAVPDLIDSENELNEANPRGRWYIGLYLEIFGDILGDSAVGKTTRIDRYKPGLGSAKK